MEIVAFKKARNDNYLTVNNKCEDIKSSQAYQNSQIKKELEKEKNICSTLYFVYYILSIGFISSINPFLGLLLSLIAKKLMNKSNEALRELGKIYHFERAVSLGYLLDQSFSNPNTVIYSASQDERLKIDKIIIDYLLTLPSGLTFAISLRTILPAKDEKHTPKVTFDLNRQQLAYRKIISSGKRYFHPEPVQALKTATAMLCEKHSQLLKKPFIHVLVIADPVILTVHPQCPSTVIDSATYMYIDGVYVVQEKKLVTLIKSLDNITTLSHHP